MKNINIMNGLVNFSAVALLFLLIIFIVFTLFCKKFKFNKKNIELYGLFLNLNTKSLIAISAMTIHYLFLVWCTITFEGLNVIYVSFIFILVLISDVALDDFKKLGIDIGLNIINCGAIQLIYIIYNYLTKEVFSYILLVVLILLILFVFLYFTYNFLRQINNSVIKHKYVNKNKYKI